MRLSRPFAALSLICSLTLSACGSSSPTGIRKDARGLFAEATGTEVENEQDRRLSRVVFEVLRVAAPSCQDRLKLHPGLILAPPSAEGPGARVVEVLAESPAQAIGLRSGDRLLRIEGVRPAPQSDYGRELLRAFERAEGGSLRILISRQGRFITFILAPMELCDVIVEVKDLREANALADSGRISISRGMMRYVRSDAELALVVAHELGHVLMGHTGAFLEFMVDRRKMEQDADAFAARLLTRSRFELVSSLVLLVRMARDFPRMHSASSHGKPVDRLMTLLEVPTF